MRENENKNSKRPFGITLLRWLLFSFCGFILFIGLLWGGLQTRWAKDLLAGFIESVTADAGDYRVKVQEIDGLLPFSLIAKQITLSGPGGEWLAARGIDFSLKISSLLAGVLDVQRFRMESVTLSRLPVSEEKKPSAKPSEKNTFPSLPRIVIHKVEVKRIELSKEVAGTPMAYSLHMKAETEGQDVKIDAVLQNLDHAEDALHLTASYGLSNQIVFAELTYFENRGGLVAGLIDLADAGQIRLFLKANGSVSDLKGNLNLNVERYGKADLDFQLALKETIAAALKGRIRPDERIIPVDVAKALGGLDFTLDGRAVLSPSRILEVDAFTFGTDTAGLSLSGTADLSRETMEMKGEYSGVDISPFLEGTGITVKDMGTVRFTARGPFTNPDVTAAVTAGGLNVQGAQFRDVALEADALFTKEFAGLSDVNLSLTAGQVRTTQVPGLKGPLKIKLSGTTPNFTRWDLRTLGVSATQVRLEAGRAAIDVETGTFSADLKAEIDRLAAFLPPDDPALNGHLSLAVRAGGNYQTREMAATVNATLAGPSGLPPVVMENIGRELTLNAEASIKNEVIQLKKASMIWKDAALKADGWLNINKDTFDVRYDLRLNKLPELNKTEKLKLAGDLESHGRVAGVFNKFSSDLEMSMKHFQINELKGENLQVQLKITGLPETPSGEMKLKGTTMDQPVNLHTAFHWSGKTLTLTKTDAELPGIALKADMQVTPSENLFSGKVRGTVKSLELLEALTGIKAQARGDFLLQAGAPSQKSKISLDATFNELTFQEYAASTLDLKAEMDDLEKMHGRATLNATDVALPNTKLNTLEIKAVGSPAEAKADLEARGTASHGEMAGTKSLPITLKTGVSMKKKQQWLFHLNTFKATYGDLHLTSPHPATVTVGDGGMALDNLEIQTGKGRLQAKGRIDGETVQASARISDLPLDLLEPILDRDMTGMADIRLDLSGTMSDPRVQLNLHVREHKLLDLEGGKPLLLEVKLNSRHDGTRFVADLELSGLGETPFKADGVIPGHLSLMPFTFDVNENGSITGKLQGRLDLSIFKSIPDLSGQNIGGLVEVNMGVNGTLADWALTGGIDIRHGLYENVEQGIILEDINGRIEGKGKAVRLAELTATDGKSGVIRLEGGIMIEPTFPMDASLFLNKATLLRKEELTSMASGKLDLKGNRERLDLNGEITLDKTELSIPNRLPPDVVIVPVTEINVPPGMKSESGPKKNATPFFMDLTVQIPSQFFVRGRGLDTEFKGKLTVKGSVDNPVIRGNLDVVRGTFTFLDRKFNVTNGQIAFSGATPPVPFLNITTQVNAGEIDARVRISGPADAFKLTLSSQPPLPQDEIMANILFGRSVAKLNAFQALQIASSINQIAGGGMPDVVGETRKLLGIDRLDFSGGDETTGPSVSVGKYVSEKVYVGVEQDLTDNKQDVMVEVDITPNFSLESKAGSKSGAGLGFNWKYDY